MNYLLSILIIAVLASQATIWHSLATVRDAIQQTNAIILAAPEVFVPAFAAWPAALRRPAPPATLAQRPLSGG
jgi:hypothetical protein